MSKKMLERYKEDLRFAQAGLKYSISQKKRDDKLHAKFIKNRKSDIVKLKKLFAKHK